MPRLINVALLLLFFASLANATINCRNLTTSCICAKSTDLQQPKFEIDCTRAVESDITYGLTVEYRVDKYFRIVCVPPLQLPDEDEDGQLIPIVAEQDQLKYLDDIHVQPANELIVENCNFSEFITGNTSLSNLLDKVSPSTLQLKYEIFKNGVLDIPSFDGVKQLSFVTFERSNLLEIPYTLLLNMPLLEQLNVNTNELTEIKGPFTPTLEMLELANNKINHIAEDAFRGMTRLRSLHLWGNKLRSLNETVFHDLENLFSLELMSNELDSVPEELLSKLQGLAFINLSFNRLKTLPKDFFKNNANLTSIRLTSNRRLENLPEELLHSCTKLVKLMLNYNNISEIYNETFLGLASLEELNLMKNRLSQIPKFVLSPLTNLTRLNLGSNQITSLDPDALYYLTRLEELDISNNRLQTLPSNIFHNQQQLKRLILSNNNLHMSEFIESTPINPLISLEVLDLKNNQLNYIPQDFLNTKANLKELILTYNKIKILDFLSLQAISRDVAIDLSNNLITSIENMETTSLIVVENSRTSNDGTSRVKINITGNPISCDCSNYELFRYMQDDFDKLFTDMYQIEANTLKCASPEDLRGQVFADVNLPVFLYTTSTCPGNCTCYHRPSDNRIIIDCSHNNLTHVPQMFTPNITSSLSYQCLENPQKNDIILEIILKDNYIKTIPSESFVNVSVTILDISYNNVTVIDWIPQGLRNLLVDHNDLTRVDKTLLERLNNITLDHNPWICDCETIPFWYYLGDHAIPNKNDIRCQGTNKSLRLLSRENLCPSYAKLIVTLVVVGAIMIIIPSIALVLFYKYKQEIKVFLYSRNMCLWFVTEKDLDRDKTYDAFISFSQQDERFILDELLPKLETTPNPYKICVHMRNWVPGEFIAKQVADSVLNSRRTIVVLSPSFLESVWGKMEFRAAHTNALSDGVARVIVIIYGDLDPNDEKIDKDLRIYLKTNTYIKWGDPWFWDKLRYALPHCKTAPRNNNLSQRIENMNAKVDKLNLGHLNVNMTVTNPPIDPLLLKDFKIQCVNTKDTPPAEKGIM